MKKEDINWELVEKAHARVAKAPELSSIQKLIDTWQGLAIYSGKTLEFYIVQYALLAELPINSIWKAVSREGIVLSEENGRKAHELLKNLEWTNPFKNLAHLRKP